MACTYIGVDVLGTEGEYGLKSEYLNYIRKQYFHVRKKQFSLEGLIDLFCKAYQPSVAYLKPKKIFRILGGCLQHPVFLCSLPSKY